ncbi:MAG: phosphoribosylglycinamide formyltransferase [Rhodothermia bacterium]|nr:phosphoribosylglycinamide formyltransferase [Rhodothermia bacterium]
MSSSPSDRLRIAVFASGGGSNFGAIAKASIAGQLHADIVVCLTHRRDAGVLTRAHDLGIPTVVIRPQDFGGEPEYVERLLAELDAYDVRMIALAGYLKKIPSEVVARFRHRIINIHPALLPAFGGKGMYGRHVHEAVIKYGARWTGVTIHLVDEEYDTGPIVLQEPVPVQAEDTAETLATRVLEVEHRLYPEALQLFATGRVSVSGRIVSFEPQLSRNPTK